MRRPLGPELVLVVARLRPAALPRRAVKVLFEAALAPRIAAVAELVAVLRLPVLAAQRTGHLEKRARRQD